MGLGDHPKTFLQKALFRQSTPSWLKVMGGGGGGGPRDFTVCSGTGGSFDSRFLILGSGFSILFPGPKSQVPSPKTP